MWWLQEMGYSRMKAWKGPEPGRGDSADEHNWPERIGQANYHEEMTPLRASRSRFPLPRPLTGPPKEKPSGRSEGTNRRAAFCLLSVGGMWGA